MSKGIIKEKTDFWIRLALFLVIHTLVYDFYHGNENISE